MVAEAPEIAGWWIRALKPQLGFPTSTRWGELELSIADLHFEPLEWAGSPELGLNIFVSGISEAQLAAAHNAVLRALDHRLGEEQLATEVQDVAIQPVAVEAPRDEWIPLTSLEQFIAWRKRKRS